MSEVTYQPLSSRLTDLSKLAPSDEYLFCFQNGEPVIYRVLNGSYIFGGVMDIGDQSPVELSIADDLLTIDSSGQLSSYKCEASGDFSIIIIDNITNGSKGNLILKKTTSDDIVVTLPTKGDTNSLLSNTDKNLVISGTSGLLAEISWKYVFDQLLFNLISYTTS